MKVPPISLMKNMLIVHSSRCLRKGGQMKMNAVKINLIEFISQRLSEHGMAISAESLEYTAERYAGKIIENPKLSVLKLIDDDIAELERILKEITLRPIVV